MSILRELQFDIWQRNVTGHSGRYSYRVLHKYNELDVWVYFKRKEENCRIQWNVDTETRQAGAKEG